jgi:hypothetical protein
MPYVSHHNKQQQLYTAATALLSFECLSPLGCDAMPLSQWFRHFKAL